MNVLWNWAENEWCCGRCSVLFRIEGKEDIDKYVTISKTNPNIVGVIYCPMCDFPIYVSIQMAAANYEEWKKENKCR